MRSDDRLSIHRALSQTLISKLSDKYPKGVSKHNAETSYINDLFSAIDADDNGFIDRDEFLQMSSESFEVSAQSARFSGH